MTETEALIAAVVQHTGYQGKRQGAETLLRCPAHDDHHPSLSVREGDDGRPLVICRSAGCSWTAICEAIGWNGSRSPDGPEAVYVYTDEQGKPLREVGRFRGADGKKAFFQRRPGAPDWKGGVRGVRRTLYRLPELSAGVAEGRAIWIVEGEKHADLLRRRGRVATTNLMGAGKWQAEYAQALKGAARVIVLADDDTPGRKHADDVARSLHGKVGEVKIAKLWPDGETKRDVVDFYAAAASPEEADRALVESVEATPAYEPLAGTPATSAGADDPAVAQAAAPWRSQSWPEFRDAAPDGQRWIVDGLLPEAALVFIAGPPKKGKTWLGIGLALAIASGQALFGEYPVPEPRPVLYVALEGSRVGLRARIGALARGLGLNPDGPDLDRLHLLYRPRPFDLVELETAIWLREAASALDAALVVVDVLRAAARFKENAAEDFALVRDSLAPLLDAGRTVCLLHHFGKLTDTQKERSPGERMAGTGAMHGALDVGLLITRSESGARRLRVEIEARDFAAPDALGVVLTGTGSGEHGGFTYTDTATLGIDPTAAEERDLAGEAETLFTDSVWRTLAEIAAKKEGIGANKDDLLGALTPDRFVQVEGPRVGRHATAKPWGTVAMLRELEKAEELARASEPAEPAQVVLLDELLEEQVAPLTGSPPEPPAPPQLAGGSEPPGQPSQLDAKEGEL